MEKASAKERRNQVESMPIGVSSRQTFVVQTATNKDMSGTSHRQYKKKKLTGNTAPKTLLATVLAARADAATDKYESMI